MEVIIENGKTWSICRYDENFIGQMITKYQGPLEKHRVREK
jgi:hypothetical protein